MIFHWENEQKYLFLVMLEDANELKMKKNTSEKERREGKQMGRTEMWHLWDTNRTCSIWTFQEGQRQIEC